MNVEKKFKTIQIYILGLGFNKRPLNLINSYIKSSQFYKLLNLKKIMEEF
jgi:hypothetical protein